MKTRKEGILLVKRTMAPENPVSIGSRRFYENTKINPLFRNQPWAAEGQQSRGRNTHADKHTLNLAQRVLNRQLAATTSSCCSAMRARISHKSDNSQTTATIADGDAHDQERQCNI